jgi:hypothetical protein
MKKPPCWKVLPVSQSLGLNEAKSDPRLAGLLPQTDQQRYLSWLEFVRGGASSIEFHNKSFIEAMLTADANAFNRVEANPLTERQRRAIVINDNANLVIAGAGTGKTSTIVGKVGSRPVRACIGSSSFLGWIRVSSPEILKIPAVSFSGRMSPHH